MTEPLHPAQLLAVEKLKKLRVGAIYIERQDGKLRTIAELIRYRLEQKKVDRVLWLCTRRRVELLQEGVDRHLSDLREQVCLCGIECLSHNLSIFTDMMAQVQQQRIMLVIDNGTLIKNVNALRTQRVLALSKCCPYRLLICETPFTRNIADMFAQWYALDWRILGYQTHLGFCINHLDRRGNGRNEEYLLQCIEPYCAQILREDVQPVSGRREYVWQFRLPTGTMAEYRDVLDRFMWKAPYSNTGVYRMLRACHHVVCGRHVTQDYPLKTEPLYARSEDNPRLQALMEVISRFEEQRVLIACCYAYEINEICDSLAQRYGADRVGRYIAGKGRLPRRFTVMNIQTAERETARLCADVIIYYSSDWDWRCRRDKEKQCQNALEGGQLTVVSLVAADTIDYRILKCIWTKDNLIRQMRTELSRRLREQTER